MESLRSHLYDYLLDFSLVYLDLVFGPKVIGDSPQELDLLTYAHAGLERKPQPERAFQVVYH